MRTCTYLLGLIACLALPAGGDDLPAVSELRVALRSREKAVASHAAYLLGQLRCVEAIPELIRRKRLPAAVDALVAICKGRPALIRRYRQDLPLGRLGDGVVPLLIPMLGSDRKRDTRLYALDVLEKIGPQATQATTALIKMLSDQDAVLRRHAAEVLGLCGHKSPAATHALIRLLDDPKSWVSRAAMESLARLDHDRTSAIPALRGMLKAKDDRRLHAAIALVRLGVASRAELRILFDWRPPRPIRLPGRTRVSRCGISYDALIGETLGTLGKPGIPLLLSQLPSRRAERALEKIGPAIIPSLLRTLGDRVRGSAASRLLCRFGVRVVPQLTKALADHRPQVRIHAADALASIGPAAAPAIAALTSNLDHPSRDLRGAAVGALIEIGPAASAGSALVRLLADKNPWIVRRASTALTRIGQPVVFRLVPLLASPDVRLQARAVSVLTAIGDSAARALISALSSKSRSISWGARAALAVIGRRTEDELLGQRIRDALKG